MSMKSVRRVKTTLAALIAIPFVVPFVFLVGTAVRTREDYISAPGGLPRSFTIDNIVEAWTEADLGRALLNTLVVCVVACLVCTLTALAGAYWFRLHSGRVAEGLRWILVAGYSIPMIAWLIPVFVILAGGGMTDNLVMAGIVNGVSSLPFALYLVHTFYGQVLTSELMEAATLDGAGVLRIFRSIAVPLISGKGPLAAALGVGCDVARVSVEQMVDDFLPKLRNAATAIERLMVIHEQSSSSAPYARS